MLRFSTYRRTFAALALALACCATIVPAASAMIPDRHHGTTREGPAEAVRPINPGIYTDDWVVSADLGVYTHDVGATTSDVIGAAADDGLVSRPAPADNVADQPTPVSAPSSGFDWSDAGIGIAIGIFAAMLLGGLLLGRRRHTLAGA